MIMIRDIQGFTPELEEVFADTERTTGIEVQIKLSALQRLWLIYDGGKPVMICGVSKHSLLGPFVFWFMPCEQFFLKSRRYIRASREWLIMLKAIYPKFRVEVDADNVINNRFAQAFGFRFTHTTVNTNVYEVN